MDDATVSKFMTEMLLLISCDHPVIVRFHDLFQDAERFYIVTELCQGGELFRYIEQLVSHGEDNPLMTEQEAAETITQVLSAVGYLHKNEIIHMDLKPENILFLSPAGDNIKLIDFHLAQATTGTGDVRLIKKPLPSAEPGEPRGTPYYIAPEVLKGEYTEKCDLWSIGCILYVMLTGYPAFGGADDAETLAKVSRGKYSEDTLRECEVSEDCIKFIGRLLTMNPEERMSAE